MRKDVSQNLGLPPIDYYHMVPNGPNEGHLLTCSFAVPNMCSPRLVDMREKPLPFIKGDRGGEGTIKEVMTYLAIVVQELCGIFPNPSFLGPNWGRPLCHRRKNTCVSFGF